MSDVIFTYAIGKPGEPISIDYRIEGIPTFETAEDAEQKAKKCLVSSGAKGLEVKVIDITALAQRKFIPKEKLFGPGIENYDFDLEQFAS